MPGSIGRRRAVLFFCLLAGAVLAPLRATATGEAGSDLGAAVEDFLSGPLAGARVGIQVRAADTGRIIYQRNAREQFVPASNEKLLVAAAALELLGPDYEFVTVLYPSVSPRDGVVAGDLVLRGGGDPTIGGLHEEERAEEIFARWARVVRARGVRRVAGDVVADDGRFDRRLRHPDWSRYPAWKWYYGPVSALSINDNCVWITVKPAAAPGEPALLSLRPPTAPVELLNVCKTHSKKHAIWFDREAGSRRIKVGGRVRLGTAGYSHEVTVPEPALYAAATLKAALEAAGVAVEGRPRRGAGGEEPGEPLLERRAALRPVLERMLKHSHNHYSEQLVKTLGYELRGEGSWKVGLEAAAGGLRRLGLERSEFELRDGSGLSRKNRVAPAALSKLLARMERSGRGGPFAPMLAAPGQPGTLENRLTDAPYRGSVRAKTGYLNGVGALSGYATARGGLRVAFSILVNDSVNPVGSYSMRRTMDGLCRIVVDHARRGGAD